LEQNDTGFLLATINDYMHVLNLLEVLDVVCFVNFEFYSGILNLKKWLLPFSLGSSKTELFDVGI
jgi:hypothetical protein